jgi:hypothetical protein
MSSDGKYQTAVVYNGQIYVSNDYGTTWVARDSNRYWYSVAMSSDGKYQTAVVLNGQIYVSVADEFIDGGLTINGNISGNNLRTSFNQGLATGNWSFAVNSSLASGNFSHAEGRNTSASGNNSHAEGLNTVASSNASHAEGVNTVASGTNSHAEGENTVASGFASHAEGALTIAAGGLNGYTHAEGFSTQALSSYSHAEGWSTVASNNASHAEGRDTVASGLYSHAEGLNTVASNNASHAEGRNAVASGLYSHAEGNITTASGNSSHAEGENTVARGSVSHAAGSYAEAAHDRTWVWKGSTSTNTLSTTRADQFMVSAAGGATFFGNVGIGTDSIANALTVNGTISATSYIGLNTGKTIYVDAGVGTDTRTGLSKYDASKPFLTIAEAVAASATGDTVYVRAGTYSIAATIPLNLKGNLHFETGTTVQVSSNVVAFSYSQNSLPIYITGRADFLLVGGTAGILTMPSGNAATTIAFECNSISGPNSVSGTLFNCAIGTLGVDAKIIVMTTTFTASNATVFNITGSGVVTARIPFVYCGVYLNAPSTTVVANDVQSRFNTDTWTLATFNTTAGITITSITTNLRIVNYNHAGVGVAFNWTEDAATEGHLFNGIRWTSHLGNPNITFASTAGTATKKAISLRESNSFRESLTNSLSASVPINVFVQNSFADTAANANVTFKVGSFTVDPLVGNM